MTEFKEIKEPCISSSDPEERKLARRLRVQRRAEARIKETEVEYEEVRQTDPVEKQIAASINFLENLSAEGTEVVTSVKIASDARELQRRAEERETRRRLLEKLEEEDEKCMEKYREITEKWPSILSSKDPLDIDADMKAQNARCLEVLEIKDAVIAELREELEKADLLFEIDLKKQNEDIDLLIDRMENQAKTITKAYRQELDKVELVIESERKTLLEAAVAKWNSLYQKLKDNSEQSTETKKEIMHEYEEGMKTAIIMHQEEFRAQKMKYETEIQKLQQDIENMKASCLMNLEKLDYNFTVLKSREDENTIVRNQQKRRINKLQDIINGLKKTYAETEESSKLEIQKLTDQVLKTHKEILDLQAKTDHIVASDDRKFMQLWDMNIKSVNKLLDQILTADRIIHEQILGIEWQAPEVNLLKKEDLPSYQKAVKFLRQEKEEALKKKIISRPATSIEDINLERRLLNTIIRQICDQCGYLVEENLEQLLSKYAEKNQLIIRLDNVFQALGITCVEELHFLLDFFLPYAYCPTCTNKFSSASSDCCKSISSGTSSPSSGDVRYEICGATKKQLLKKEEESVSSSTLPCSSEDCSSEDCSAENSENLYTPDSGTVQSIEDDRSKRKLMCPKGHLLEIETSLVSKALMEFVEKYEFIRGEEKPPSRITLRKEKITITNCLTDEDIVNFWEQYEQFFPEEKEKLWDVLLIGLKKYYEALKERHELNAQAESLRRQNIELRRLLKTCKTQSDDEDIMEDDSNLTGACSRNTKSCHT